MSAVERKAGDFVIDAALHHVALAACMALRFFRITPSISNSQAVRAAQTSIAGIGSRNPQPIARPLFGSDGALHPRTSPSNRSTCRKNRTNAVFNPQATVNHRATVPQKGRAFGAHRQIATRIQRV